jgi:hypothetical protein
MTPDLSLIPMEDLIKEVESRCNEFICAFTPNGFQTKQETMFLYGTGSHHVACGLANVLNNDVLNNWNGELQKLQGLP